MDVEKYEAIVANKERPISIIHIVTECKQNWKWFVLSAFCMTTLALTYVSIITPQYERSAELIIKDEDKTNSLLNSMNLGAFSNLGLLNNTSNINNEIRVFQSIETMQQLAQRLNLTTTCKISNGLFSHEIVSSDSPIKITFPNIKDNDFISLKIKLYKNGKFIISKLKKNENTYNDKINGNVNNIVKSSIGLIALTKTRSFISAFKGNDCIDLRITKERLYDKAKELQENISIKLTDDQTSVLDISYQDISGERAENIINTLIAIYQEEWLKDKNSNIISSSKFIDERIRNIEKELSSLDGNISQFKGDNLIPDYEEAAKTVLENATSTNEGILKLNNQLYVMEHMSKMMKRQSRQQLLPANLLPENENVNLQIKAYNDLLLKRSTLVENSSNKNPIVESTDNQISSLRHAIESSMNQGVAQLKIQLQNMNTEKGLVTNQISSTPKKVKQILPAERQQKVIEAVYIYLLQKKEENSISQIFTSKNIRVITPPVGKIRPVFPKKIRTCAAALLLGFILPLIFIFIRESKNNKIRVINDIGDSKLDILGEIPLCRNTGIIVQSNANDACNESFRILRNKLFRLKTSNGFTILTTSSQKGSGKTFTAINLAKTISLSNKNKVALIDLNFRNAGLSHLVKAPSNGIAQILNDNNLKWEDIIFHDDTTGNVDIIPAGTIPENPTELLSSNYLIDIIKDIKNRYNFVVIDTTNINKTADVDIIAPLSDINIFVLRSNLSEKESITISEKYTSENKLDNAYIILNGITTNS